MASSSRVVAVVTLVAILALGSMAVVHGQTTATPTLETKFTFRLGDTDEVITAKFWYCDDFNSDPNSNRDIKVELSLESPYNAGTEDIKGVAFDLNTPLPQGLTIPASLITRTFQNTNANTFTPVAGIAVNNVRSNCIEKGQDIPGCMNPDFLSGGAGGPCTTTTTTTTTGFTGGTCTDVPYDAYVTSNCNGDGCNSVPVSSVTFVLTADVDIGGSVAVALLSNTDWYVRLQSTTGTSKDGKSYTGTGSAKTGGAVLDLPACTAPPPPPPPSGINWCSPGFWRNHLAQWPPTTANGKPISTETPYAEVIDTKTFPITLSRLGMRQGKTTTPTLLEVLQGPQFYGGASFNAVGDLLSDAHCGITFTTGTTARVPDSCPLSRWSDNDCNEATPLPEAPPPGQGQRRLSRFARMV